MPRKAKPAVQAWFPWPTVEHGGAPSAPPELPRASRIAFAAIMEGEKTQTELLLERFSERDSWRWSPPPSDYPTEAEWCELGAWLEGRCDSIDAQTHFMFTDFGMCATARMLLEALNIPLLVHAQCTICGTDGRPREVAETVRRIRAHLDGKAEPPRSFQALVLKSARFEP